MGALAQLIGFVGFVIGLVVGSVIAVPVASHLDVGVLRGTVTVVIVLGVAMLGGVGGNVIGRWSNVTMRRLHLGTIDAIGGAAVAAIGALLSAWLVAGLFTQTSVSWLTAPIQRSLVLTTLDAVLPPVPSVVARAQAFLSTEGFPAAFADITPPSTTGVAVPSARTADLIAAPVADSVLKVIASGGCGEDREGSSFVVAPGLVMTDAHVIAGEPVVEVLTTHGAERASVVEFDADLDVAVLRMAGATPPPIALDDAVVAQGTEGAVVGYPGGGPRIAIPAGIAGSFVAEGRDIYGSGLVERAIYAVSASVRPGSSGSPLVVAGRAVGMVFSRSVDQANLAYAIEAAALTGDLHTAEHASGPTTSGTCTPG